MTRLAALMAIILTLLTGAPAAVAADVRVSAAPAARMAPLPFARSERAQAVWASRTCRSECGSYCAWGQTECLYGQVAGAETQGQCLKLTDDCDRTCQRSCRTSGGPLLPLDF